MNSSDTLLLYVEKTSSMEREDATLSMLSELEKWCAIDIGPGVCHWVVPQRSEGLGQSQYVSGVLTSLSCVLALSNALAQLPSGLPSPSLHLRVYAGLTDLSLLVNSSHRDVMEINNKVEKKDNKYFPNLVLLKLETPFQGSSLIQSVVFNVGMLSPRSTVVGWAHLPRSNTTLSYAVAVHVVTRTSTRCNDWALIEFQEQMCCYDLEPHPLRLNEGALLVDQGCLTAIKQFDTYLQSHRSTPIALFVRIGYFIAWIENVAMDPLFRKVFLQTNFDSDDITQDPWHDRNEMVHFKKAFNRNRLETKKSVEIGRLFRSPPFANGLLHRIVYAAHSPPQNSNVQQLFYHNGV